MTRAEYNAKHADIKRRAKPLMDEGDRLEAALKKLDRKLTPLAEEKMAAQHTFFGCFECAHAIEDDLGKRPCCSSPIPPPTEGKKMGEESDGLLNDETPACKIFIKGTPKAEAPNPFADMLKSLSKLGHAIAVEPDSIKGKPDNGKPESNSKKHRDH